jgi:hypothetical protein
MGQPNFQYLSYPLPLYLSFPLSMLCIAGVDITRSVCPSVSWPGFTLYIYLAISLLLPPPVFHLSLIFKSIDQLEKMRVASGIIR